MLQRVKASIENVFFVIPATVVIWWVRYTMWRMDQRKNKHTCLQDQLLQSAAKGDCAELNSGFKRLVQIDSPRLQEEILRTRDGNGWTLFQLAAGKGHTHIMELLVGQMKRLFFEDSQRLSLLLMNDGGSSGQSPLILSLVNRHDSTAQLLVKQGVSLDCKLRGRNPIYLAGLAGLLQTSKAVLARYGKETFFKMASDTDDNGYNALYAAALGSIPPIVPYILCAFSGASIEMVLPGGSADMCQLLLDAGVCIKQASTDGSSAIHAACRGLPQRKLGHNGQRENAERNENGRSVMDIILSQATVGDLSIFDRFGSTSLHLAAANANSRALTSILSHFNVEDLIAQDNDGFHPIHSACNELCRCAEAYEKNELAIPELESRLQDALECVMVLLRSGYPLDATDYADATALHILCHRPTQAIIEILTYLNGAFEYSQDRIFALLEAPDCYGWTCLHQTFQTNGVCSQQLFFLLSTKVSENFLSTLNPAAAKIENDAYHLCRGEHNRIPIQTRKKILGGNFSPQGIAKRLLSLGRERQPRVTVLLGAGVSTSAGIKDFRSSNGLYSSSAGSRLMSEEAIHSTPAEFFGMVRDVFLPVVDGMVRPTRAHALLKVLKDKGWLQRVFTQNVDTLEYPLLDLEDVVECHGSFRTARCINPECDFRADSRAEMQHLFWDRVRGSQHPDTGSCFPSCPRCSALLRPEVIFLGEGLPTRFQSACKQDLPASDLVLVLGTSLRVYPVAGLPQDAGPECLRVLVNHEAAGCFQYCPPWDLGIKFESRDEVKTREDTLASEKCRRKNLGRSDVHEKTERLWQDGQDRCAGAGYRDVFLRGGCDDGAQALAVALGWEAELQAVVDGLNSESA